MVARCLVVLQNLLFVEEIPAEEEDVCELSSGVSESILR